MPPRWSQIVALIALALLVLALLGVVAYTVGYDVMLCAPALEPAGVTLRAKRMVVVKTATRWGYGVYNPSICNLAPGGNVGVGAHHGNYVLACRQSTMHMGDRYAGLTLRGYDNSLLLCNSTSPTPNHHTKDTNVWWRDLCARLPGEPHLSFEDVRLFYAHGRLWGLACVFEAHRVHLPVLIRFDKTYERVEYHGRFAGLNSKKPNKNWVAVVRGDEVLVHRDTFPTFCVDRLEDLGGVNRLVPYVSIDVSRAYPELPRRWLSTNQCVRGTSNWCRWPSTPGADVDDDIGDWMFIAHTQFRTPGNPMPIYRSMLIVVRLSQQDSSCRLVASSDWLNLDADHHARIQFASALDVDANKNQLTIGMGLDDCRAAFATFDMSVVRRLLMPICQRTYPC